MPIELPKSDRTVAYSFRTTPKIMQDLNNYAKVKNTTVPLTLNEIIKNSLKNKTLTREINRKIQLPIYKQLTMEEKEKLNNTEKDWINDSNYKEHDNKWFKICPNNVAYYNNCLDVWKDDTYKSDNEQLKHEGLHIHQTENNNIVYVKIDHYLDSTFFAYVISTKEAIKLVEKSKNRKLIEFIEKKEGMNVTSIITGFVSLEDYEKIKSENKKLNEKIRQLELILENK